MPDRLTAAGVAAQPCCAEHIASGTSCHEPAGPSCWLPLASRVPLQVKASYQHAVKESIVLLGFEDPAKAAQLAAHHIENVRICHPVPEQGCVNLAEEGWGQVVTGMQVWVQPACGSCHCCAPLLHLL